MKFVSVNFRSFGPFEDRTLDFTGNGGLHVIFGANEAGKSSALRGLYALLFGWGKTTADDYHFKTTQFRVQASLQSSAGELLDCVRRKGLKATLLTPDEKQEITDTLWAKFLGSLQQSQFEQLFGLDSERLVAGGRQIADGKGDLGEALFAAGAGLAGLRKLAESLQQRQNSLYKSAGKNQPIAVSLREYRDQVAAIRDNSLLPEKYAAAVEQGQAAEKQAQTLREERERVRREQLLLDRYQQALLVIDLYRAARERLAVVAKAPLLPADFEQQLQAVREKRGASQAKLQDLQSRYDELKKQQQAEDLPTGVLDEESEIDELKKLVGAEVKAREEEFKADTRRRQLDGEARDIFRELTNTTNWDQMLGLQPRLEDENRIRDLAADAKAVAQGVTNAETKLEQTREALSIAAGKQRSLAPHVDPTPLVALTESILARGPLEEKLRELQTKLTADEQRLASEFSRLQPAAPGDWKSAATVSVPASELIAEFVKRRAAAENGLAKTRSDLTEIERDLLAEQGRLAASTGTQALPSLAELHDVRQVRDGGLQLIRRRLSAQADETAEHQFTAEHAPGRSLIDTTEIVVHQADSLADRLRTEAEHIANCQALQQKLDSLQARRQTATAALQTADAESAKLEKDWQAAWQAAGIAPQSPPVMQAWLGTWQRLVERLAAWQEGQQAVAAVQREIVSLQTQLAAACPATKSVATLSAALSLAGQVTKEAAAQRANAAKLEEDVQRLQLETAKADSELQAAQAKQKKWKEAWSAAIVVLGLQDGEISVTTAHEYLKRIAEMQDKMKEARIKAARIKEITEDRATLLQRISAVRQRLNKAAKPTTAESLDEDFRQLEESLKVARVRRTQFEDRSRQLQKQQAELATTTDAFRQAEAALGALAAQVDVTSSEQITPAVQSAKERLVAEKEVREHEQVLLKSARGQGLDDFIAAAVTARENLDERITTLARRAQELDPEIAQAEAAALQANLVLKDYLKASDAAAEAKQKSELVASRLEEQVLEFAALQLANIALERAKERYRARHQDTMLSRAGEFFRMLTDEKFATLEIFNEEGQDVLKAVRPEGHANPQVPISGLSEGTRDQLFLALRLAGIEQHLQNREPVPLIIDDVLMTFDDARASATLKCLAELSQKTQVLLFTHHQHVADLAKAVHPGTKLHTL
ncbi:AAA family ATPase [Anatilimnocola sp. NA78]|uniref:AAA family ATPase n=1 Tax=Anatilimnocola sp. NA78 TaxID=3415683 RepID=UPI003CE524E6